MTYDPAVHHRRSIRLPHYDYSSPGLYFVTLCTQGKTILLGGISEGKSKLNPAGQMVEFWWKRLPAKFSGVLLEEFVVMPNHLHGLLALTNTPGAGEPGRSVAPLPKAETPPLSRVIQWFKTMTTNAYFRGVREAEWAAVPGKLWLRNYYEHVVRSPRAVRRIATYILENPSRWSTDIENPNAEGSSQDPIREIIEADH